MCVTEWRTDYIFHCPAFQNLTGYSFKSVCVGLKEFWIQRVTVKVQNMFHNKDKIIACLFNNCIREERVATYNFHVVCD